LNYSVKISECLLKEVNYRTSRSSGPGGQHVNRTETRVELVWNPENSLCLDPQQLLRVKAVLHSRLSGSGQLLLASGKYRSQARNKEEVTDRFLQLIARCLVPEKPRRPTRPSRASKERRIEQKKQRGEVKKQRRPPRL
jgi:ribosome-associated protein